MQVSWIEPDEVRALAALLQDAAPRTTGGAWDVQTLPEPGPPPQPLLQTEAPPPPSRPAARIPALTPEVTAPASPPPPSPAPVPPPPAGPEVAQIRETLRVIRDRARQAGLLQEEPPPLPVAPPAPAEPLDAPPAPAAASPLDSLPPLSALQPPPLPEQAAPPPLPEPLGISSTAFLPLEGPLSERLEHFATWASRLTACTEIFLLDDHGGLLWGRPSHPETAVTAMLAVQNALRGSAGSLHGPPGLLNMKLEEPHSQLSVIPCSTRYGLATLALLNAGNATEATAAALREALVLTVEAGTGGS